jgi:uncharacterized protein
MTWTLVIASLLLGLAAVPHCAVMCGAPCAAVTGPSHPSAWLFHSGRALGYSAAGALAAASVASLGSWVQATPALRPLWTLVHLMFLFLGLWWLIQGRQPTWLLKRSAVVGAVPLRWRASPARTASPAHLARRKTWRSGAAGLAWVAWPCAALQAALLLAALANTAIGGAAVMLVFALTSAPGLLVAPWALARWQAWRGATAARGEVAALGFRLAGLGLLLASGWALTQSLWQRAAAWCGL